jgi:hypothetical protein
MIIQVLCSGAPPEWLILELQGKLSPLGRTPLDGRCMGRLEPAPSGDPSKFLLQLGTYRMTGSLVSLPKPLAVLQKRRAPKPAAAAGSRSGGGGGAMDEEAGAGAGSAAERDEDEAEPQDEGASAAPDAPAPYELRAVVRRKFVFDDRPQPIVGTSGRLGAGAAAAAAAGARAP